VVGCEVSFEVAVTDFTLLYFANLGGFLFAVVLECADDLFEELESGLYLVSAVVDEIGDGVEEILEFLLVVEVFDC
jgi:hypothetical protein